MQFTDTHTHLFLKHFSEDIENVIQRAINNGVTKMFLPNVDKNTIADLLTVTKKFPDNCYNIMGLHPCSVKEDFETVLEYIENIIDTNTVYGIGETGIDLYWDKTTLDKQILAFRHQIRWAKEKSLPIIIHARESLSEILAVMQTEHDDKLFGIFHCFSGTLKEAEQIREMQNFKLGIGGPLTYKNSKLPEIIKNIDLQYIVLETDSPFLPPIRHRGQRNESAYIVEIAEKIAEIKNISIQEVAKITNENSWKIFNI